METVTLSAALAQKDFDNMITRYHFRREDRTMLWSLYQALVPLLDIRACFLSKPHLRDVDLRKYAAVFLTLGSGIDALQDVYLQGNHMSEAYMLECIGMELLTRAYGALAGKIQISEGGAAVRMHFIGEQYPYSVMDEMREQMGETGISFNAQYSMSPQKSVAFLLEFADTVLARELTGETIPRHTHNSFCHGQLAHICSGCNNVDCEYRQKENNTYGYQRIFGGQEKKG